MGILRGCLKCVSSFIILDLSPSSTAVAMGTFQTSVCTAGYHRWSSSQNCCQGAATVLCPVTVRRTDCRSVRVLTRKLSSVSKPQSLVVSKTCSCVRFHHLQDSLVKSLCGSVPGHNPLLPRSEIQLVLSRHSCTSGTSDKDMNLVDSTEQEKNTQTTAVTSAHSEAGNQSDDEDADILPVLKAVTPNIPPKGFVEVVPGKGPPPEPPVLCCMSGCVNCVWIRYAEDLRDYFTAEEGNSRVLKAIEEIEDPGLKMFLKLELGLL